MHTMPVNYSLPPKDEWYL